MLDPNNFKNMRPEIIFSAALAAALLTACDKAAEIRETECAFAEEMSELKVIIPLDYVTRASGTGSETDENALSSVQVFVFNDSGNIEAYKTASSGDLNISCTMGKKTVVALVNAPEASAVKTIDGLRGMTTQLTDNDRKSFVMYGESAVSVAAASVSVTVEVRRFAAKIILQKITNRIELVQYQSAPIEVTGLYLINVAGNASFSGISVPTLWLNKSGNKESSDCLFYEKPASLQIACGSSDASAHHFYCYPNPVSEDSSSTQWTPRHTRLVIEAIVGGHLCYYPITLPKISGNTIYTIGELTVTRLGTDTPDVESVVGGATFEISVAPWENETVQSVTI